MADKPTSPTAGQVAIPAVRSSCTRCHSSDGPMETNLPSNNSSREGSEAKATTPTKPSLASGSRKFLAISNLMSPPEAPKSNSFSHERASRPGTSFHPVNMQDKDALLPSPPTSVDDDMARAEASTGTLAQDPILYPSGQDVTRSPQQRPLFERNEPIAVRQIVDEHVIARSANLFGKASPPKNEEYELILDFKSRMMELYKKDPNGWLKRERAQLMIDRRARAQNSPQKLQPILPAKVPQVRKETQRARAPKPSKVAKAVQPTSTTPRPIRSYPATGSGSGQPSSSRLLSEAPEPTPRRAVAPNREDKDFASLKDYCPPLDSLPHKANSLKVDWKGTPIDLSNDPHRHLLHPDEITLAANLRLDCATYLTSKRRMFIRRLECLRVGKEFRKTDAQQACKIDVNKASKLWTAFDKVGWLDKRWMINHV
ncbi:hypothetical protein GGR52DRAFT_572526 [Hypoxylon sp. FL1284]|nr:hypothetical protein GGR52DRAFT_572526 [Hypoxylon sp. FL1284]